jgi:hypothetical protein
VSKKAKAPEPHPAAAAWPMLPEPDLRRLAEDIAANGLRHPVVLDKAGMVLDGRNRLAACTIAGVEPTFETYEGDDPEGYVLSTNERRHMSLPERAAATALTLATNGGRAKGRWKRGSVPDNPESRNSGKTWADAMTSAGLVLDYLGEGRLRRVAEGKEALDAAVNAAKKTKAEQARVKDLPDDLRTLVETGDLTIADAERRHLLTDRYAKLVAAGDLSLDEAEHLNDRDEREYRESIQREKDAVESFLFGYSVAAHLKDSATRNDVLNALSDHDRERFLTLEKGSRWHTKTT